MSEATAQKIVDTPNGYTDEAKEVAEAYLKLLEESLRSEQRAFWAAYQHAIINPDDKNIQKIWEAYKS